MRPDERAALAEILRSKKRDETLKSGISTAASLGTAALGLKGATKILPFLNRMIPDDLAMKGLSKVSPFIGNILQRGKAMGLNVDEGLNFLREQFGQPEQDTQAQANEIEPAQVSPLQDFETNYPDIARALMTTIQQGQPPQAAAAILKQSSSFSKDIKRLEKEVGKNFVDYILEIYGNQQQMAQQQAPQVQPQQMQPQQMAPQEQGLDPQLLQIMNNIRQSIGQYKGG